MNKIRSDRPVLGVDFHVWDGIFQGSRSHLIGLYTAAIRGAPDIDFIFFLDGIDSLKRSHPEFTLSNVRLVRMPHRSAFFRLAVQIPMLQWRYKLDLLHMQYRLPFFPMGACACTIHDILFETHPQYFSRGFVVQSRATFRMAARKSALLFTVSHFSKNELARLYSVPLERIAVTYNGVNRNNFRPGEDGMDAVSALGLSPGNYLLTVGRLEPRKNHVTLIKAYARLGHEAPILVIVGQRDFNYMGVLDLISELGLDDRVKLFENIHDDVLPAIMRHAKIFVYPAFAEGFGMPVAEAMASGVPVITSNTTSLPEVVGDAAILVDPHSVGSIESALRRFLGDTLLRSDAVRRGLDQVKRFDWELSASMFLRCVRSHLLKNDRV